MAIPSICIIFVTTLKKKIFFFLCIIARQWKTFSGPWLPWEPTAALNHNHGALMGKWLGFELSPILAITAGAQLLVFFFKLNNLHYYSSEAILQQNLPVLVGIFHCGITCGHAVSIPCEHTLKCIFFQ